jgi:Ca2+-transporting ATPase
MQMLWVNLIMDTLAAQALATEPARDEVLSEPPRSPRQFIITRPMAAAILGMGGCFVVLLLVLLKTDLLDGQTALHHLTLFFNVFVWLQIWNLLNTRAFKTGHSGLSKITKNPAFALIFAAIVVGQVLITQFGDEVFRTTALPLTEWRVIAAATSPVFIIGEIIRKVRPALK